MQRDRVRHCNAEDVQLCQLWCIAFVSPDAWTRRGLYPWANPSYLQNQFPWQAEGCSVARVGKAKCWNLWILFLLPWDNKHRDVDCPFWLKCIPSQVSSPFNKSSSASNEIRIVYVVCWPQGIETSFSLVQRVNMCRWAAGPQPWLGVGTGSWVRTTEGNEE